MATGIPRATVRALECTWNRIPTTAIVSRHIHIPRTALNDQFGPITSVSFKTQTRLSTHTAQRQAQNSNLPGSKSTPKPSSSIDADSKTIVAQPPEQTLERRLRFLSRPSRSIPTQATQSIPISTTSTGFFNRSENDNQQPASTNISTTDSKDATLRISRKGRKYNPGFKPGDFICPQCGTHNFRPPEYTQVASQHAYATRHYRKHQDLHDSHEANEDIISSGSQESHTQPQEEMNAPRWKYPQGASARCFECHFETSYPLPQSASSPKSTFSTDATVSSDSNENTSVKAKERHEGSETALLSSLTQQYRKDIRLSGPRDYICPSCQTVNYSNRLYCVGCGSFAPWIKTRIVEKRSRSSSKKSGRSSSRKK
ncbi:hypothetical protein FBU30_002632 [Linnemannia zychae]|nr:hypothetical protein FBU30_002632 [Linnemannia zychae]